MYLKFTLHLLAFLCLPYLSFTQVCDNVTDGGSISANQTLCTPGETPAPILDIQSPSGGSGDLEYIWISTTNNPDLVTTVWNVIPGSTGDSYAPGPVYTTTYFRRCARRVGCEQYIGESNIHRVCVDLEAPTVVSTPDDETIECDQPVVFGMPEFADDCDYDLEIVVTDEVTSDGCTTINTRTWKAIDECYKSVETSQTITQVDTTDPVFTYVPADETIECDQPVVFGTPEFTDNCDDDLDVYYHDDVETDGCTTVNTRTWTITDNCGNTAYASQTITQVDTTDPVFTYVPADETIECDQPVVFGTPEFTDNCDDDLDVYYHDDVQSDGCTTVNSRTWTITDNCGNYATAIQIITQIDTTDPVITLNPPYDDLNDGDELTIECDALVILNANDASATDNCDDDVTITFTDIVTNGDCLVDGYLALWECTWTATDNCGNQSTFTLFFKVVDTTNPVFTYVPADETIECDQPVVFGTPEFTDNCDYDLDVYYHDDVETDGCTTVNTRTWTITDDCGNTAYASQAITQVDTTDPVFTYVPADETIECDQPVVFGTPEFTDNCDDDLDVYYHDDVETDGCTTVNTRTWTITDNCGNTASASQVITQVDTTDPVFTYVPADETIECDQPVVFGTPEFTDNCDDDLDVYYHDDVETDGCTTVNTRTWTITDNCGNTASASQVITQVDTTDPVFTYVPADETIECDQPVVFGTPEFTDNCDDDLDVYYHDDVQSDGCTTVNTRTWTITDNCGNTASASQVITQVDTTDPVFTYVPADETIECDQPVVFGTPEYTDNCDDDLDVTESDDVQSDGCTTVNTRTWTITDNCGNYATASQVITQVDTTDPVFTYVPADETIECDEDVVFGTPEFTDNCDDDLDIYYHDDVESDGCTTVNTRTWTITDNCGNTASASQVITQVDTTDPVFTYVPADETIECDEEVMFGTPEFTDNCDDDLDMTVADSSDSDGCTITNTRTYTITDNCGNYATATQVITQVDTTDPVFTYVPADETIECDEDVVFGTPEFTDNCDDDLDIYYHDEVEDNNNGCIVIYTRTWTITDNCGNTASASQVITQIDSTAPAVSLKWPYAMFMNGDTLTFECTDVPILGLESALVIDNCDDDPTVEFDEELVVGDCPVDGYLQMMTCSWTATDNCDNASTFAITIIVVDTTDPVISDAPADMTIECGEDIVFGNPTVTDNCDYNVVWIIDDSVLDNGCEVLYMRTWTAYDDCGNSASVSQTITTIDTIDPVFTYVPADETIECDEDVVFGTPVFEDSCDDDLAVMESDEVTSDGCTTVNTRTWTIVDDCGNTAYASQTITQVDTTDPVFTYVPADETIECDQPVVFGTPEFTDNCDDDLDIYYHDDVESDGCTTVNTRTWTITDNCGNTASASQVITQVDTTDPVFTYAPADETIECDEDPVFGMPEYTDNCDDELDVVVDDYTNVVDLCTTIYTRTWTITDNCGNSAAHTQTITAIDTQAPALSLKWPYAMLMDGETYSYECTDAPILGLESIFAEDNCDDDVDVTFDEEVAFGDCPNDGYLQLMTCTWTAVDNCDNVSTFTIHVKIIDTTRPVFTSLPGIHVEDCDSELELDGLATASDNCDFDVDVTYTVDTLIEDNTIKYQINWLAQDDCGNAVDTFQIVNVPCGDNFMFIDIGITTINGESVDLHWTAMNEMPGGIYSVQRSKDGEEHFTYLDEAIPAEGLLFVEVDYNTMDLEPMQGLSFYRVQYVDSRGKVHVSPVVSANFEANYQTLVYPNPASDNVNIELSEDYDEEITIDLHTRTGQTLQQVKVQPGVKVVNMDIHDLTAGMYFITIQAAGSKTYSAKIIKTDN